MDNRDAVSAFLRSRRDRITPDQAGLPAYGQRRVPGLRRGEVATLAGVSVEYYTRLERGNLKGVSDSVLDALSKALRLDDTERIYLYDLARAAGPAPRARARQREVGPKVRPSVARIVEGMPGLPAYVMNNRLDALTANSLGRALYSEVYADPTCGANVARFAFLNPAARRFYVDWERMARFAVGALRVEAGKNPYDRELSNLIGELSTRSDSFRVLWGSHDVHVFRDSTKRLRHPVVGDLELDQETMSLPDESGLSVVVYSAPPATAAEDALKLLANWSATTGPERDAISESRL
ncbi:helix-turn-helix domain-containing protein [Streptomyces olivochromogenes]|uniref:helix-turn-helix domain-containing protein n=1 Tax=Streptomyces olivochromogenes TaxID=1963 RepID=UPI001F238057|nr:helix-turn-helix transcriptional regulator [Streptomyces olivochromogenes]MCF3128865.1 helix-turn-helix domain-containing protein [Streptomyces olivochromogenes]